MSMMLFWFLVRRRLVLENNIKRHEIPASDPTFWRCFLQHSTVGVRPLGKVQPTCPLKNSLNLHFCFVFTKFNNFTLILACKISLFLFIFALNFLSFCRTICFDFEIAPLWPAHISAFPDNNKPISEDS